MDEKQYFEWIADKQKEHMAKRGLPPELLYPFGKAPITGYLSKWARAIPDKPAIIYYGTRITYRQLDELSNQFANYLIASGLDKGDFVGIHLYNCPQYMIAHFGGLKAGCTIIPLDPLWKGMELEAPMGDARPRVIVTQDVNYPIFADLRERFGIEKILTTSFRDFLPAEPELPLLDIFQQPRPECPGALDMMPAISDRSTAPPQVEIKLEDTASLDYTGGTTGPSKGCFHTHLGVTYTRSCMYTYFGLNEPPGSAVMIFVPLFHTAGRGQMEAMIFSGLCTVLLTRFDFATFLMAINRYKVFMVWGPSDLWDTITRLPEADLKKFDLTSLKNATCTQYNILLNQGLREKLARITNGGMLYDITYGLTETLSMNTITLGFQDVDLQKQEEAGGVFIGLPMPETRIKIVDSGTKQLAPPRTVGELAIMDPALSPEYFNRPEENAACYLPDGFLITGDLGMYDEDGFFYYTGRSKEVIKVSGLTVSPREIELIMGYHPAIKSVAVVGAPDPKYGEIPVAFIIPKSEYKDTLTQDEIIAWCQEKMSSYKVPRRVAFRETFPYLLGLKVDRQSMKKEARDLVGT